MMNILNIAVLLPAEYVNGPLDSFVLWEHRDNKGELLSYLEAQAHPYEDKFYALIYHYLVFQKDRQEVARIGFYDDLGDLRYALAVMFPDAGLVTLGDDPQVFFDENCPRCGMNMQATHHPLCQARDGTPTPYSDEQVREYLAVEAKTKYDQMPVPDSERDRLIEWHKKHGLEIVPLSLPEAEGNFFAIPAGPAFPCPVCGQEMDHYRNVGKNHYGVCLRDKVYFWIGYKLFSSWLAEGPEVWEDNQEYLAQFRLVEDPPTDIMTTDRTDII